MTPSIIKVPHHILCKPLQLKTEKLSKLEKEKIGKNEAIHKISLNPPTVEDNSKKRLLNEKVVFWTMTTPFKLTTL